VTTTVYFVLRRIDREASQRITALRDISHGHIGFLDMAAQSIRFEQGVRLAITVELLPYRGDHHGIGCKLQGQSLVFVEVRVTSSARPTARSRLAATRPTKLSPMHVSTGTPT
jgi:hypothetical protein